MRRCVLLAPSYAGVFRLQKQRFYPLAVRGP